MTPSGIEPATFWFVTAQYMKHKKTKMYQYYKPSEYSPFIS